ncbi:MAG: hypothetical protein SFW64_03810 [Alphaproteobacteria bacterium]|nr:hypothetical protein [Alphaproteobacteria bacterium]
MAATGFFAAFAEAGALRVFAAGFAAVFLPTGFLAGTALADFFAGADFFAVARGGIAVTP